MAFLGNTVPFSLALAHVSQGVQECPSATRGTSLGSRWDAGGKDALIEKRGGGDVAAGISSRAEHSDPKAKKVTLAQEHAVARPPCPLRSPHSPAHRPRPATPAAAHAHCSQPPSSRTPVDVAPPRCARRGAAAQPRERLARLS